VSISDFFEFFEYFIFYTCHFTVVPRVKVWHVAQLWSDTCKKFKKFKKKIKKTRNGHVALTLTPSGQTVKLNFMTNRGTKRII